MKIALVGAGNVGSTSRGNLAFAGCVRSLSSLEDIAQT